MRRFPQWIVGVALALGSVWALRAMFGPVWASLIITPPLTAAVIGGWALIERWLFPPTEPAGRVTRAPQRTPQRTPHRIIDVQSRGRTRDRV